jgi:hypothetical protein|tara:strand:- start:2602 stop:3012 length:411 start_codon:yes stop_codon:yes gene_type:complete
MEFNIRQLEIADYKNILVKWWKDWNWQAPEIDFLPEDGAGGMMILEGDIPICAGFIYMTNSKVAWVDWIISNKEYKDKTKRKKALLMLIDVLTLSCQKSGAKYAYALLKHTGLQKHYKQLGYKQGDKYNQEMIKIL